MTDTQNPQQDISLELDEAALDGVAGGVVGLVDLMFRYGPTVMEQTQKHFIPLFD